MPFLRPDQLDAVAKMKNGCVLNGGVGSGKTRVSLEYYTEQYGGRWTGDRFIPMKNPDKLYVITTASKRDLHEWEDEMIPFHITNYVVDSWNNIRKYENVKDSFFIFDEDKVTGKGTWVKAFYKIARANKWIILSATPGDTWSDYIPVFIANGFYRTRSEFLARHAVYSRFTKYPKIDRYIDTARLYKMRESLLVNIDFKRKTIPHVKTCLAEYNQIIYKDVMKNRVDPETHLPFTNAAEYCFALRKIVNSDPSRIEDILGIFKEHPRLIIFYNYDYELDILLSINFGDCIPVKQKNGHRHDPLPEGDSWVYLVNYGSGAEAWNCITTDAIVFYSQNYSYRVMIQSMGRIDRSNTPYVDLYYYILRSTAPIELSIARALATKKKFNESKFVGDAFAKKI